MTLGEFVKNYRREHNMSIRSFASMTDISAQQISNIEKGIGNDGKPMTSTMGTYAKIAKALGMTEKEFLKMLNDDVLVNPSEEKITATNSDGDLSIAISNANEDQIEAIKRILQMDEAGIRSFLNRSKSL